MTAHPYIENADLCKDDILKAREAFGSTETTRKQYNAIEKALGMIYLYGPDEVKSIALATIEESIARKVYFEMNIWPEQEKENDN